MSISWDGMPILWIFQLRNMWAIVFTLTFLIRIPHLLALRTLLKSFFSFTICFGFSSYWKKNDIDVEIYAMTIGTFIIFGYIWGIKSCSTQFKTSGIHILKFENYVLVLKTRFSLNVSPCDTMTLFFSVILASRQRESI